MHADMIAVDQFPNLEVNQDKASQGFQSEPKERVTQT